VIKTERMGWLALAGISAVIAVLAALPDGPTVMPAPAIAPPAAREIRALVFEENLGQTNAVARFIARGAGYTQFVTADAVVWRLDAPPGVNEGAHAIYMDFPGARPAAVRGAEPLGTRSNYLRGSNPAKWVTGARHYASVLLADLYPGIDLELHGARGKPEYDFIVAPRADLAAIRIRFQGADGVTIGADGALSVRSAAGELIHHRPVAYQRDARGNTTWVDARFVRSAPNELRFEVGAYDGSRQLVIDPVYEYSTYLGGTGSEALTGGTPDPWQAITVNAAGEVYAAGITNSTDFPTTPGAIQPSLREDFDFHVVKLNAAGDALLYSTYLGGTADELGVGGISVNPAGEILFAGTTQSNDFPTTPGAFDTVANGTPSTEVVALKINTTGTALVYSTYLGSSANESLYGFAMDSGGRIVVAGQTVQGATTPFPFTAGAYSNSGDQFVTKIALDGGSLVWSSSFGIGFGGGIRIRALALDSADNVYLTGRVSSFEAASFPLQNAYDTTLDGSFDGFVTKMNSAGSGLIYSTFLGGSNTDEALAIAVDSAGSAYVAGSAVDFPVTPGAYLTTPSASLAGFLAKLAPAGNALVWATYTQRPNFSSTNSIALDAGNRVYLTTNGVTPLSLRAGESPEVCLANVASPSILRFAADGASLDYGMRIGAPLVFSGGFDISAHLLNDVAVDSGNNVYVMGTTNSADFPTYAGLQGAKADGAAIGHDAFIAKLSDGAPFAMPTLAFSAATYGVVESAGNASITVNRTGRAAGPVKVRVQTSAGTATATADYTNVDTVLEWRNGDLLPKTVNVPIVSDALAEGAETINLALTDNWCLGDLGAPATAVLTINDSAPLPAAGTLQISAATYSVAEGGANATITVTRTGGSDGAVSARLATSNGTATAGSDYTATDTIVNFAAGDAANKTVNVPVAQDTTDEPDETVNLTLSAPTGGATLGAITGATLTITDDDAPASAAGVLQLSAPTYSVTEDGANATITVMRTGGSDGAVSARLATANGTATAGSDYTTTDTIVNFAAGDAASKTVTVPITQDTSDEPDETVTLTLSTPTGGATLGTASATMTIVDDDLPAPQAGAQASNVRGKYGGALDGLFVATLFGLSLWAACVRRRRAMGIAAAVLVAASSGVYADDGWYIGARAGIAETTQKASDLDRGLAARGHDVSVSLDENDPSYSLFGGYRWANGLALEGAWFELGEYEVSVSGTTTSPSALLSDTESLMGDGGRGVSAAIAWSIPLGKRFEITPRVGAYYWDSRQRVRNGVGSIEDHEFGVDLFGGLTIAWKLSDKWSIGAGYEVWAAGNGNDIRAINAMMVRSF
jgi:hypothetical protein